MQEMLENILCIVCAWRQCTVRWQDLWILFVRFVWFSILKIQVKLALTVIRDSIWFNVCLGVKIRTFFYHILINEILFFIKSESIFRKNVATHLYLLQGTFNSGLPEIRKKDTWRIQRRSFILEIILTKNAEAAKWGN